MSKPRLRHLKMRLSVPWMGFVVAFLYYTALTAGLLGGVSPDGPIVTTAYLVPFMMYAATIAVRLAGSLAMVRPRARPTARLVLATRTA